jgi:hypothetical protein
VLTVSVALNETGIAVLEIANRAASAADVAPLSDYDYRFGSPERGGSGRTAFTPWHILRGHRRSDGAWALVSAVLARHAAGGEEMSDYTGR